MLTLHICLLRALQIRAFYFDVCGGDASRCTRFGFLPVHDAPEVDSGEQEALTLKLCNNRFHYSWCTCPECYVSAYGRTSSGRYDLSPHWPAPSGAMAGLVGGSSLCGCRPSTDPSRPSYHRPSAALLDDEAR